MDQDTIHLLFPNLNKLLNFQRKFLIRLESTGELPWKDQRWGQHFLENVSHIHLYFFWLSRCMRAHTSFFITAFHSRKTNSLYTSHIALIISMQWILCSPTNRILLYVPLSHLSNFTQSAIPLCFR